MSTAATLRELRAYRARGESMLVTAEKIRRLAVTPEDFALADMTEEAARIYLRLLNIFKDDQSDSNAGA